MINFTALGITFSIVSFIFIWILFGGQYGEKEKKYNPKYAKKVVRLNGITPYKGSIRCVVNPQKWVIVNWNKKENYLDIVIPPQGWLKFEEKINIRTLNWKITKEIQPEKVTVEKYFSNTKIM